MRIAQKTLRNGLLWGAASLNERQIGNALTGLVPAIQVCCRARAYSVDEKRPTRLLKWLWQSGTTMAERRLYVKVDCWLLRPWVLQASYLGPLENDLETMIPTFPPQVVEANRTLKANVGAVTTPPGASPRLPHCNEPAWSSEPQDR